MLALRGIWLIRREVVEAKNLFELVVALVVAPVAAETKGAPWGVAPLLPLQDLDPGVVVARLLAPPL